MKRDLSRILAVDVFMGIFGEFSGENMLDQDPEARRGLLISRDKYRNAGG